MPRICRFHITVGGGALLVGLALVFGLYTHQNVDVTAARDVSNSSTASVEVAELRQQPATVTDAPPSPPRQPAAAAADVVAFRFTRTIADFGRKLHESSLPEHLASDGFVHKRNVTCCLTRFLTSAKIPKKYGLTNVMLFVASMMAYAGLDNRAVVFPEKSPVDVEELLDFSRTEALLAPVNVRLATRSELLETPRRLGRKQPLKKVSAWRVGIHLGYRALSGSNDATNASIALSKLNMNMGITRDAELVSYGDFFLRFPFYAIRPLDDCLYLRRMIFSETILSAAMRIVSHLHHKLKIKRLLALHLRLEGDAKLLDKQLGRVSAAELGRFMRDAVAPLVAAEQLDGVYVCSGPLDVDYLDALRTFSRDSKITIVMKSDVPGISSAFRNMSGQTTSHFAAAVDLTVMEHATVAVSTSLSTFMLAVLSRRCRSPKVPVDIRKYTADSILFSSVPVSTKGSGRQAAGIMQPPPKRPAEAGSWDGAFSYDIRNMESGATGLGELTYVGCDAPWKNHCFFPET